VIPEVEDGTCAKSVGMSPICEFPLDACSRELLAKAHKLIGKKSCPAAPIEAAPSIRRIRRLERFFIDLSGRSVGVEGLSAYLYW